MEIETEQLYADGRNAAEVSFRKLWLWSVTFLALALMVANTITHHQVGPAEQLGQQAYEALKAIPNNDIPREWFEEEKKRAFEHLVLEVAKIEEEFPGTIEFAHQEVPLGPDSNPFKAQECINIATEECSKDWPRFSSLECARECPFNTSQPDGDWCCGNLGLDIERPLVPFASNFTQTGTMQNVVFAVKGFNSSMNFMNGSQAPNEDEEGQALMASAHYDSAQAAPGIGDDLAGVAVLLEVARSLASRTYPLRRDVIFTFVDGEERGLLGATVFRHGHPWRKRPAAVINLEGKGKATGKSWMLRANSPYMAQAYASQVPRPAGNSLSEFIWAVLNPGGTDLQVYRRLGYHMMDVLFIQDAFVYHTVDDTVEKSASPEGLQHEAGNVLSIMEFIANDSAFPKPLNSSDDPTIGIWNNQIYGDGGILSGTLYFTMFDLHMVAMPILAAQILFVTIALAVPIVTLPAVKGRLRIALAEFGISVLLVILGVFSGYLHARLILVHRDLRTWYEWNFIRFVFLGFGSALPMLLFNTLRKGCGLLADGDHTTVLVGAVWAWCFFLLLFGITVPHVGPLLIWFPLFAAAAIGSETVAGSVPGDSERELAILSPPEMAEADVVETSKDAPYGTLMIRDTVAVALPAMFYLSMDYNLINTLSFVTDGIGFSVYNGVLAGLLGALGALPFFSMRHRLSGENLRLCMIVEAVVYFGLILTVLLAPYDESAACHFNRDYCGFWQSGRSANETR